MTEQKVKIIIWNFWISAVVKANNWIQYCKLLSIFLDFMYLQCCPYDNLWTWTIMSFCCVLVDCLSFNLIKITAYFWQRTVFYFAQSVLALTFSGPLTGMKCSSHSERHNYVIPSSPWRPFITLYQTQDRLNLFCKLLSWRRHADVFYCQTSGGLVWLFGILETESQTCMNKRMHVCHWKIHGNTQTWTKLCTKLCPKNCC